MKTTLLICVLLTIFGAALVSANMACDKMVLLSCSDNREEADAFIEKLISKMTDKCMEKANGLKGDMEKSRIEICAGKADADKTCEALRVMAKDLMGKMGEECHPMNDMFSCETIVQVTCSEEGKKMCDTMMERMTPECKKIAQDITVENDPKIKAICDSADAEDKKCDGIKMLMMDAMEKMGEKCTPELFKKQ